MVSNGFSLLEIRKLYEDELYDFYNELVYILESKGEVKKGSYDRLISKQTTKDETLSQLRKQMYKVIANK